MQTTSALYKSIVATSGHYFKTKVEIAGKEIPENQIISLTRKAVGSQDSKPAIGGALASQISLTILKPSFTIPRMGEIAIYIQACEGDRASEWIRQGVFFIDTRKHNQAVNGTGTLTLTAFDAMMKAEDDYPETQHGWPYLDRSVVAEIASAIGVSVDSRTNTFLTAAYMINLPAEYTMRETLGHIAACYGGNSVITKENKLLFIPLYGLGYQESGFYLADESGNALTFGSEGWCILV